MPDVGFVVFCDALGLYRRWRGRAETRGISIT